MGEVYFYHMTRTPLEETLPVLLARSREAGWNVAVRGGDPALLQRLDDRLWIAPEDGFVPHGMAGGGFDAEQPVLLTTRRDAPNGAACLMAIGGAEVETDDAASYQRVCILFDGNDLAAVEAARAQWRGLTQAGCKAKYWSQESGRWEMKAET